MALKHSKVCTLTDNILVRVKRILRSARSPSRAEGRRAHRDFDQEHILDRAIVEDLTEMRDTLQYLFLDRLMFTIKRVIHQRHDVWDQHSETY